MTNDEAELVRLQISTLERRAETAERERDQAVRERDSLRALLIRTRTSLNEAVNDPAQDGTP
jgi:hypothetical protein